MSNSEGRKRFGGVIPPIITPMTENFELDRDALERHIEFLIEHGVSGIFIGGTSGEAGYVSLSVQEELTRVTIEAVRGRVEVLVGAIEPSTVRVIERIKALEQLGTSFFVVTPAFYLQNSGQSEVVRHFENVCASTKAVVAAYNIPGTTHVNMLPETIRTIAAIDNVRMYKDSCADFEQIQRDIFQLEDTQVSVFNGAEELCAASAIFGAEGIVPGLANFLPELFVKVFGAGRAGRIQEAISLQREINEIRKVIFVGRHWMAAMKYLAFRFGFGCGALALPVEPLTDEQKRAIDGMIEPYRTGRR